MTQWVSIFLLLALLLTVGTSCASKDKDAGVGLTDNMLKPCPNSPNCVCSEYSNAASAVPPLSIKSNLQEAWTQAIAAVKEMGGTIVLQQDSYLHATFTSKIFRFVDDFELRLDTSENVIHIRSASRIGYSDLGVNRKRVERFRSLLSAQLGKPDVHPGN